MNILLAGLVVLLHHLFQFANAAPQAGYGDDKTTLTYTATSTATDTTTVTGELTAFVTSYLTRAFPV